MAQLVEALRYKPEGRGFDSDGIIDMILPVACLRVMGSILGGVTEIFPFGRSMAPGVDSASDRNE